MASDLNLEAIISADASGVKTGMKEAEQAVASSTTGMEQSAEKLASGSESAMQRMVSAFKNMASQHAGSMQQVSASSTNAAQTMAASLTGAVSGVQGGLGSLGTAIGFIGKNFGVLAGVVAGAGVFKEGISATKQFTGEAMKLSRAMGTTASEAAIMNVALGDVGVSTDDYSEMSRGMMRQLKMNEASMQAMGLETRNSSGAYKDMGTLMKDAAKVLGEYKEGTDQTLAAQVLFGRGVSDVGAIMKAANANTEEAKAKAEALGLTVGVENVKAAKDYKMSMHDVSDAMLGIKKAIGDEVMPVFTELGNWLASVGPAAVVITKGAFGGLAATFWLVRNGVVVLWETINAMVITVTEPIRAMGAAITKALTGDLAGAKNEIANVGTNMAKAWGTAMDEIEKSSVKTNEKIKNLFSAPTATKKVDQSKKKDFVNPKEKKSSDDLMKQLETELSAEKVAYQEKARQQGSFQEYSNAQELAFWQAKLKIYGDGGKSSIAMGLKINSLKLQQDKAAFDLSQQKLKDEESDYKHNMDAKLVLAEQYASNVLKAYGKDSKEYESAQKEIVTIHRQMVDQLKQIDDERAKTQETHLLDNVAAEQEASQLKLDLGLQTKAESIAQEQVFEDKIYDIKVKALQDKLALAEKDPDRDKVAIAKIHSEIEQLETDHQAKLRAIINKATVEQQAPMMAVSKTLESSLATSMNGILMKTMTWKQAMTSLFSSLGQSIITELAVTPLTQMAASLLRQTAIYKAFSAFKLSDLVLQGTAEKGAAAATVATDGTVATAKTATTTAAIAENTGLAFSAAALGAVNAMASVAAIPFVGWAMAPGVGAETYATGSAFATMASARNGFDIPAGVNPITQLHEREMVLPQKQADAVRQMADGGGGGGAFRPTLNIQAMNSQDVIKSLKQGGALNKALTSMHRNFTRV